MSLTRLACSVVRKWTCNIFPKARTRVLLKAQQYTFSSSGIEKYLIVGTNSGLPCNTIRCRFVFYCFRLDFRLDIRSARWGRCACVDPSEFRAMRSSVSVVAVLLISFSIPLVAQGKLELHSFTPDTHT